MLFIFMFFFIFRFFPFFFLKVYERMNVPVGTAISYEMFMNMHKKDASCLFPQQQVQVGYVKDSKADAKLQKMKSGISQTGASSAS